MNKLVRSVSPDGRYVSELALEIVDSDRNLNRSIVNAKLHVRRASKPWTCPKLSLWDRLRKRRGHLYRKNSIMCRRCGQYA